MQEAEPTRAGLSTGAKIGIIVPVVLIALAATAALIAFLVDRSKPPEEDIASSYITGQALEI